MSDTLDQFHLFDVIGIELEYMIVNRDTLAIAPITDQVIFDIAGQYSNEIERSENISWSNELALHVIELKTTSPIKNLLDIDKKFHRSICEINFLLKNKNCVLLPGAMHPTMNPDKEMRLWPHDYNPIYETFNSIFSCRGHGWSNLQSMHINLPFSGEEEFGRLHAAIRLVLPIIPAIAASSPIYDGKTSGFYDSRMEVYRTNSKKIPSISGDVIPEQLFTYDSYQTMLSSIYNDLAPFDPLGVLQEEWVNARGAIARFDRNTIEIRVIDIQECPSADIAIAAAIIEAVRYLVEENSISYKDQKKWQTKPLQKIFLDTIQYGEQSVINDQLYLNIFGIKDCRGCTAQQLWAHIVKQIHLSNNTLSHEQHQILTGYVNSGTLAGRILKDLHGDISPQTIRTTYKKLCTCLSENAIFNCIP